MFSEALDRLIQAFKDMFDQMKSFSNQLADLLDEESEIWKLHRCRVCGRTFYTSVEAQKCVERHRAIDARAAFRGRCQAPMKYCGKRIAPRNREGAMRSTELRRRNRVDHA